MPLYLTRFSYTPGEKVCWIRTVVCWTFCQSISSSSMLPSVAIRSPSVSHRPPGASSTSDPAVSSASSDTSSAHTIMRRRLAAP